MVFSSMVFIFLFLPVTCAIYFIMPTRTGKNAVLLSMSLLFYAWGEPVYLLLMAASIFVNWLLAPHVKKTFLLILAIIFNLSMLLFFKYAGFAVTIINTLTHASFPIPEIALPIGISFYTFQALSYIIDVRRGDVPPQKNLLNLALYISLFPQLIAGPIVRYTDIEQQIENRHESLKDFCHGLTLFIAGLAAKVIIANNMATVADGIFNAISASSGTGEVVPVLWGWVAILAYTFQIYFDFSGYSTMAIGLGLMFGFTFIPNFNYPYMANSVTDFWRRWHISLSHWFRDYVYIPMGGNRCSVPRHIFNILTVWMLTGLWHGAALNFVIWGLYYGLLLLMEKYLLSSILKKTPSWITGIITFFLVSMGWVLFRTDNSADLLPILKTIFTSSETALTNSQWALQHADLISKSVFFIPAVIFSFPIIPDISSRIKDSRFEEPVLFTISIILLILCISLLEASTYNPFIYFRF